MNRHWQRFLVVLFFLGVKFYSRLRPDAAEICDRLRFDDLCDNRSLDYPGEGMFDDSRSDAQIIFVLGG